MGSKKKPFAQKLPLKKKNMYVNVDQTKNVLMYHIQDYACPSGKMVWTTGARVQTVNQNNSKF